GGGEGGGGGGVWGGGVGGLACARGGGGRGGGGARRGNIGHGRVGRRAVLREPRVDVSRRIQDTGRPVRRSRRAVGGVQVLAAGIGERHDLHIAAAGRPLDETAAGRLRRDVELRAATDVLVRTDALRQRVRAGVHEDVHAGL